MCYNIKLIKKCSTCWSISVFSICKHVLLVCQLRCLTNGLLFLQLSQMYITRMWTVAGKRISFSFIAMKLNKGVAHFLECGTICQLTGFATKLPATTPGQRTITGRISTGGRLASTPPPLWWVIRRKECAVVYSGAAAVCLTA